LASRKKSLLKFLFITLPLLGLMLAWLGFGERGFIHLYKMEKKREASLKRIFTMEKENQKLLDVIQRLQKDQAYIESVARRELGLIKEDEILYRFTDDERDTPPETGGTR
jgi:cell division protein FtsB